jgi:DNA-cytosine methyltransferase
MSLQYLSLFSGIGGFEVGIHRVFPDAKCVGFSEIDPNSIKVYQKHFPDHKSLGPVQDVKGDCKVDLVVAGSPCNDLSSTNVKSRWGKALPPGLQGKKSGLFYEFVRIIKECKPRYFILENVGSMKTVDKDIITGILGVEPIAINSVLFTPQNRKRFYWTNIPLTEEDRQLLETSQPRKVIKDILISPREAQKWVFDPKESKLYQSYVKKMDKYGSALRMALVKSDDDSSPTLLAGRTMWVDDKRIGKIRKMSPIEAERLQTFPDGWTDPISYTNRLKSLGNAVTCDVVTFLMECLHRNGR